MKNILLLFLINLSSHLLLANVRLPRLFADNMILQRDQRIPVWGWADANEMITIQFAGQTKKITAGKDGKWKTFLGAVAAGGPHELKVQGKNILVIKNILMGDVWVCSGQSN